MRPLEQTLRALEEAHYRFTECAREYGDPTAFVYALNAAIQAARNVTFVLQNEKANFVDFKSWYEDGWRLYMKSVPLLVRLVDARNIVVKRGGLKVASQAHIQLVNSYLEPSGLQIEVPVDMPSGAMAALALRGVPRDAQKNAYLLVERRWVASELDEGEVLSALARGLHVLDCLVDSAVSELTASDRLSPDKRVALTTPRPDLSLPPDFSRMRIDPATGRSAELLEGRLPDISDTSLEDMQERYGESSNRVLEMLSSHDPIAAVDSMQQWVCSAMTADGHLTSVVFLHHPTREAAWSFRAMAPRNQAEKYALWQEIGRLAAREGYDGFVFLAEAWTIRHNAGEPLPPPPYKPRQREGEVLIIHAECADGRRRQCIIPVTRDLLRRPVLGEPVEQERDEVDSAAYAMPVRRAWGLDG